MPYKDFIRNKAKKIIMIFNKRKNKKELRSSLKEIKIIKKQLKDRAESIN